MYAGGGGGGGAIEVSMLVSTACRSVSVSYVWMPLDLLKSEDDPVSTGGKWEWSLHPDRPRLWPGGGGPNRIIITRGIEEVDYSIFISFLHEYFSVA